MPSLYAALKKNEHRMRKEIAESTQKKARYTHASRVGTAYWPVCSKRAPGADGSETGVRKLAGIPVLRLGLGCIIPSS